MSKISLPVAAEPLPFIKRPVKPNMHLCYICSMIRKALLAAILGAGLYKAPAQQRWNFESILRHVVSNNISVQQLDLQSQNAAITYKQSKQDQYPSLVFNTNGSVSNGTSQDPTTFSRNTQTYFSSGINLQSSAELFNFYRKKNAILANEWELHAAKANTDKLRSDLALSAANAYLQILLAWEQFKISELQLSQTKEQLRDIRKRVDAGALPELNATQLEAQLAMDSLNVVAAKGNIVQQELTLKNIMSIPARDTFDYEKPTPENIPLQAIGDLQPEYVYQLALKNMPQQRYNDLKLKAAGYSVKSSKAAMYPSLSAFASLGSGFSSLYREFTGVNTVTGAPVTIGSVTVNGNSYNVTTPYVQSTPVYRKPGYFNQFGDNFNQNIGIGISAPIFQGGLLRSNYERSKLNLKSLQLQQVSDDLTLQQDIFQAYNAAVVALEKKNAAEKLVAANEKAYNYASKRFDVGVLGTYDLLISRDNLLRSRLELSTDIFDYVFKMKVLEFYKGEGLQLK